MSETEGQDIPDEIRQNLINQAREINKLADTPKQKHPDNLALVPGTKTQWEHRWKDLNPIAIPGTRAYLEEKARILAEQQALKPIPGTPTYHEANKPKPNDSWIDAHKAEIDRLVSLRPTSKTETRTYPGQTKYPNETFDHNEVNALLTKIYGAKYGYVPPERYREISDTLQRTLRSLNDSHDGRYDWMKEEIIRMRKAPATTKV